MTKNTSVETAQKGQATNKNTQPEKVVTALKNIDDIRKNKSKVPTGKVTLLKETEARKKTREEQYRNFRINALKRRCKRMGFDEAKTEEYVKKLIEQLNAPKEYDILIMFNSKEGPMMRQAMDNAKIKYKFHADTYFFVQGDQNVLAKIREIAPPSAKIHPYAKKMESVIDETPPVKKKKPTNNTVEKRKAAKDARKKENIRKFLNRKKGKGKAAAWGSRKISLAARRKMRKATTIQLKAKKGSTASKKASTPIKKAA